MATAPTVLRERIKPWSTWEHKNGNRYTVVFLANIHSNREEYPVTVVYKGDNGLIWTKPIENWYQKMTFIEDRNW